MNNLYASIDIGTDTVKMIVAKKEDKSFKVIACAEKKSDGVKKGAILDVSKTVAVVSDCKKEIEEILGIKVKKIIACIPTEECLFDIVSSKVDVMDEKNITGKDINNILKEAITGKIKKDYELVSASPIGFKLDTNKMVKDPKGLSSKTIDAKLVITEVPRKNLYNLLNVLQLCELEPIDIIFKTIGDYFEIRNSKRDNSVGAIINIGEDTTNISIYNKGIMIKNTSIKVGSYYVDHDFSYIYKISMKESRRLKETFAMASTRYADKYDEEEVTTETGKKQVINQYEISQIAEARLEAILKIAKKQIKILTNRQISYIIILGGLSEMNGFQYIAENILGTKAVVWNSTTIGIRHNKYTSVLGAIKYFNDKLMLRDRKCEMFDTEDINEMISTNNNKNNTAINKLFEQFIKD
ncbi:MAG: hypothetical protein HFJ38_04610 [Bacilli bacterium]|nr:hypothetical protein [Bacilli bacterium]